MRFVDSNVFVYHMAQDPMYGQKASTILKNVERGEEVTTSSLVIAQVCAYLKWKKRMDVIPTFLSFLQSLPSLAKVETSFMDFTDAKTSLRRNSDWKLWDDLVIAAQMKRLGIREIYTNDRDFDAIPGVTRVFG